MQCGNPNGKPGEFLSQWLEQLRLSDLVQLCICEALYLGSTIPRLTIADMEDRAVISRWTRPSTSIPRSTVLSYSLNEDQARAPRKWLLSPGPAIS